MLARDAENLYWMARYLGRAENTARLILSTTEILLDLPNGASLGWGSLLQIAGIDRMYKKHYADAKESDVMHFLIADERNPSSILSSVKYARENTRTLRELLPEELWERINGLYLYISNNLELAARDRRNKYLFLQSVINQRHSIVGMIASSMEHDLAYHFIQIGTYVERADMTSRIMDINYAITLPTGADPHEVTRQTLWVGILKALSAFLAYRRLQNVNVNMIGVTDFLFHESRFPRSVIHCLNEIEATMHHLPHRENSMGAVKAAQLHVLSKETQGMDIERLHQMIDIAQQHLGNINLALAKDYFGYVEVETEETIQQQA